MMISTVFVPIGLIIYGWTAEKRVFWLAPDIGMGIFAFGKTFISCLFLPHDVFPL